MLEVKIVACEELPDPFGDDVPPRRDPADAAASVDAVVEGFRGLRGWQRDQAFMVVEREIRRLQAVQAAMLHEVSVSVSYVDDAHNSPTAWVQAVTNSSKASAWYRIHVSKLMFEIPWLAAAVADGTVGADQLRLFVQLFTNPRCGHLLVNSQHLLLEPAKCLLLHEFRVVCDRWLAHADPDGAHRDHQTARGNRNVRCHTHGAGHELFAQGDALTGDIITEIIDHHMQAEYDNDVAWRLAEYGDQADLYPLPRTTGQRRYDAFVAVVLKGAGRTGHGAAEVMINIFTNEPTFAWAVSNYFAPDTTSTQDLGDPAMSQRLFMCHTASGAPVDPHDLVIAALIGNIRRVVTDTAGRVIDLGRSSRLFTGAARQAVLLTGDRCCRPGCEQRGDHIQIDHLTPFTGNHRDRGGGPGGGGGHTNPGNGGPMCGPHNRAKHNSKFSVTRDHTGWHHYRPDGTEIAPRH